MYKNIFQYFKIGAVAVVLSLGIGYVFAWTAPTVTPPGGNVSAPINTGSTAQTKSGTLSVGKLKIDDIVVLEDTCTTKGLFAVDASGGQLFCDGTTYKYPFTSPNVHRYSFYNGAGTNTTDTFFCNPTCSWTVPAGVRSGFVTMAGGGASGHGYKITSKYLTGASAGNVQNVPISFIPGENLSVTVGKGGAAYAPLLGLLATSGGYAGHNVPVADTTEPDTYYQGTRGYPGTLSKIVSTTKGTLLECSGAGANGVTIDGPSSMPVPGDGVNITYGYGTGGSFPLLVLSARPALGTYGSGGAGRCGPSVVDSFGAGMWGSSSYSVNSGGTPGASTPMGYGSGGGVGITGCVVTTNSGTGLCLFYQKGSDGVVYIDVSY